MALCPEDTYQPVLVDRYCRGSPLLKLFSERNKVEIWRQLWINLAEAEMQLGLPQITIEMILEMRTQKSNIDWPKLRAEEKRLKHDVMAHNHCFGAVCPMAAGIIHLGATSCYVQDNADLIIQRQALNHVIKRLAICLHRLSNFAEKYSTCVTLGRTHFQAASLVTVGKRACIWMQELLMALNTLTEVSESLRFRGIKGATGTQDSFLTLFNGDEAKVDALDDLVTTKAGFTKHFFITGQTYSRQQDSKLIFALANFASSVNKICFDIRNLQALGELSEPFETDQIGSSAMPYKRNPIRSERVCSLARYLAGLVQQPLDTLSVQGFERTLDDSANRRIVIAEAFFTAEAILSIVQNIFEGLVVHEETIALKVSSELPFLALEKALMFLTELGVSRQEAHSKIREVAFRGNDIRLRGGQVTIQQLLDDPFFPPTVREKVVGLCTEPLNFCGRCVSQVNRFIAEELHPKILPLLDASSKDKRVTLDV